MSDLVLYAIPAFLALIALEWAWARRHAEATGYGGVDTVTSLGLGLANVGVSAVIKLASLAWFAWLYQHRVVDVVAEFGALAWLLLLVAEDLCYYAFHRSHHEIRLLWAAHVNHHSSQRYNLSTALRQSVTTPITAPIFWSPLALIGFPPWMIFTAQAWSLLYQFWLHTEAIDRLGPLEWVLNTPSHHRVHHGKNPAYLDRNHGGIFIVWDRLFGTFAVEDEPVRYGLTTDLTSQRPLTVAFHEFAAIGRDLARAPSLRAALAYVFGPPGWSADGPSQTARAIREAARAPRPD
ncbi:MAG: sterol desaturase family protein [Kofleriaceae bacterium]